MILNLKGLNKFVKYTKFKMDGIEKVLEMFRPSYFCSSLDFVSAYGHVYVDPAYHSYFQFTWWGQFYCYTTLPQGYSDSPQLFVHCTQPIMSYFHKHMIDILIYIDDTFLCAPNYNEMLEKLEMTRKIFTACGLTINKEKSCLILTQKMEFLGFWLDSVSYSISVGQKKCSALS